MGHVRDVNPQDDFVLAHVDGDGVVEVLGVDGVDRPGVHLAEVFALVDFVLNLGLDVVRSLLGFLEDFGRKLVAEVELLEQFLALVFEVSREFLVDFDRALAFGSARVCLGVLLVLGSHALRYEDPTGRRFDVGGYFSSDSLAFERARSSATNADRNVSWSQEPAPMSTRRSSRPLRG